MNWGGSGRGVSGGDAAQGVPSGLAFPTILFKTPSPPHLRFPFLVPGSPTALRPHNILLTRISLTLHFVPHCGEGDKTHVYWLLFCWASVLRTSSASKMHGWMNTRRAEGTGFRVGRWGTAAGIGL